MSEKLKILVTGKNRRIVKDVSEHCEYDRGYTTVKCRPDREAIFDIIYSEMPNVVIICMSDETSMDVRMYNILTEAVKAGGMSVFVVASEDDKQLFMKYTELKKVYFLSRPVSLFTVYEKLISIEKELEEKRNSAHLSWRSLKIQMQTRDQRKKEFSLLTMIPSSLCISRICFVNSMMYPL